MRITEEIDPGGAIADLHNGKFSAPSQAEFLNQEAVNLINSINRAL